jgi:hypothetical protein
MEGGRPFRASCDLLSIDFSTSSQTSNNEAYLAHKGFDAVGFHLTRSGSATVSISATLMG